MSQQIGWCVELAIKPGQLGNFVKLTAEMIELTRNEFWRAESDQRFVSGDETTVHAIERYVDLGAALRHLQNFAEKFAERFLSMVDRKLFTVHGTPSPELKELLDGFSASYLRRFGNLEYWPQSQRARRASDRLSAVRKNFATFTPICPSRKPDNPPLAVYSQLDRGGGSCGFRRFARSAASLR